MVGYGRSTPEGSLPVYSVATEAEAQELLVMACPTNDEGSFVAPDLIQEQTLVNLEKFSLRLDRYHEILVEKGHCNCGG